MFEPDYKGQYIIFKALADIPAGQEILVDYHAGNPDERIPENNPLWINHDTDKLQLSAPCDI